MFTQRPERHSSSSSSHGISQREVSGFSTNKWLETLRPSNWPIYSMSILYSCVQYLPTVTPYPPLSHHSHHCHPHRTHFKPHPHPPHYHNTSICIIPQSIYPLLTRGPKGIFENEWHNVVTTRVTTSFSTCPWIGVIVAAQPHSLFNNTLGTKRHRDNPYIGGSKTLPSS